MNRRSRSSSRSTLVRSASRSASRESRRSRLGSKSASKSKLPSRSPSSGFLAMKKELKNLKKGIQGLNEMAKIIYPKGNFPDTGKPSSPFSKDAYKKSQSPKKNKKIKKAQPKERPEKKQQEHLNKKAYDNWIKNARKHRNFIKLEDKEFKQIKKDIKSLYSKEIRESWNTEATKKLIKKYLCDVGALTSLGRQQLNCSDEESSSGSEEENGSNEESSNEEETELV
jgi:hypothetical protein